MKPTALARQGAYVSVLVDFTVEAAAGLTGVFAGVFLALRAERARQKHQRAVEKERADLLLAETRKTILAAVVKNTGEAKVLAKSFPRVKDPYLFEVTFELAAWTATQAEYARLATLEERIIFTRFFDRVARLSALVDFCRHVRSEVELHGTSPDAGDRALIERVESKLRELSEDVHLDGVVLVTDFGEPVHKRILGIQTDSG